MYNSLLVAIYHAPFTFVVPGPSTHWKAMSFKGEGRLDDGEEGDVGSEGRQGKAGQPSLFEINRAVSR